MNGMIKRLTALMAALMLFLSASAALAEGTVPTAESVLNAGGAVAFEAQAQFDGASLKGIMGLALGGGAQDEATNTLIDAAISALNRLHVRGVYAKDGLSGYLGTQEGELINLQAVLYDEETMDNALTTNLLPGIALVVDPAMVKSAMGQMPQMSQAQAEAMLAPYGEAVLAFIQAQLNPQPLPEPLDIPDAGQFAFKADFELTTREVAELMEKLYNIFKNDKNLQAMIQQAGSASGEDPMEALKEMEEGIAEMKAAEDKVILSGVAYLNEAGDTTYVEALTPQEEEERARLTLLIKGGNLSEGTTVSMKLIAKGEDPYAAFTSEELTTPEPVLEEIDWDAVEADILSFSNFTDTLITLDISFTPEGDRISTATKLGLIAGGMNITVENESQSLIDRLETQTETRFFLGDQNPLITITVKAYQTDEHPQLPQLEGLKVVTLKTNEEGELVPNDVIALEQSMANLPGQLMANIAAALPEEGPALLTLISGYLTAQEPEIQGPEEPLVIEETEPAEPVNP
mgnify:FL=1